MMNTRIAVVGATGLVGAKLLEIMNAEGVSASQVGVYASKRSAGSKVVYGEHELVVKALKECDFSEYDAAFFCVGDKLSKKHVPRALKAGCAVVDKSNTYRLDPEVPLVVPGVNDKAVTASSQLVANPNCTTIVLMHALCCFEFFELRRVWAATYQSVSGAGKAGVEDLIGQTGDSGFSEERKLGEIGDPLGIAFNLQPMIGKTDDLGYCGEENKLIFESRKILGLPQLDFFAHTVRVPVLIGHGIAVTMELMDYAKEEYIVALLDGSPDVDFLGEGMPSPIRCARHDQVEVGRLRKEYDLENGWSFFVCGDNVNIGAALNGWRILKLMDQAGAIKRGRTAQGD